MKFLIQFKEEIYVPDCEADDVIGYLSRYTFSDDNQIIFSSDKDFYQLLGDNVEIYSPTRKGMFTKEDLIKNYQICPENFCLAKCISGDTSDNISGIKGAGFKTIAKRFPGMAGPEEVTIDDIVDFSIAESKAKRSPKIFKEIAENKEKILRNWKLIYLDIKNLSHNQIQRIHTSIDTFSPRRDKISTMRILIREGIQTLDVDRFFLSLISCKN